MFNKMFQNGPVSTFGTIHQIPTTRAKRATLQATSNNVASKGTMQVTIANWKICAVVSGRLEGVLYPSKNTNSEYRTLHALEYYNMFSLQGMQTSYLSFEELFMESLDEQLEHENSSFTEKRDYKRIAEVYGKFEGLSFLYCNTVQRFNRAVALFNVLKMQERDLSFFLFHMFKTVVSIWNEKKSSKRTVSQIESYVSSEVVKFLETLETFSDKKRRNVTKNNNGVNVF